MAALIENVPLILTSFDGAFIQDICERFTTLGYSTVADVLVASDYGVPQIRKRAFILAYRSDLRVPPQFPSRTHERVIYASELLDLTERRRFEIDKLPYVSVADAIGDLPQINAGGGDEATFYQDLPRNDFQKWARARSIAIFNHRARNHKSSYLEKISVIKEGGGNATLEKPFSDNYYSQAYARLHRNGIAQTITTSFGNPGSGRFMHYRELRAITVREAARFQSFPDIYVFHGHYSTQMRHVGNAVPPLLAHALANQILVDFELAGVGDVRGPGRPKTIVIETPKEIRSRTVRAVPSKHTSPELLLRRALWSAGLKGFRRHVRDLPGTPDFVFPRHTLAIFVDGCFWHGCSECYRAPKTNRKYWILKVARNRERDRTVAAEFKKMGWALMRNWEHEVVRNPDRVCATIKRTLETRGLKKTLVKKKLGSRKRFLVHR